MVVRNRCLYIACFAVNDGYQSARQRESDAGSIDFEDRSYVKEECQSQRDRSFGNSVEQEVDKGESDSGISANALLNRTFNLFLFLSFLL